MIENKKHKKDLEELKKNRDWHVVRITDITFEWEKCKRELADLTVIHKQTTVKIDELNITIVNLTKNDASDSAAIAHWKGKYEKCKKKYKHYKEDYEKLKDKYDHSCKKHTELEVEISVHVEKYTAIQVTTQTWEAEYNKEKKAYNGVLLKLKECEEKLNEALKDDKDDDA
jgi:chromosome segregation ATPase